MTIVLEPTDHADGAAGRGSGDDAGRPFVSVDDLAVAYATKRRPRFCSLRQTFEQEHGQIVKFYFGPHSAIGAVLVQVAHTRRMLGNTYRVHVADAGPLPTPLVELVHTVMHEKHRLVSRVHGRARDILVHDAFSLIVYLLATSASSAEQPDAKVSSAVTKRVREDLDRLHTFAQDAARRTALWFYLMGLGAGAAVGLVLIVVTYHSAVVSLVTDGSTLAACLAGGVFGAVISVMVRVTRGTTLDVDSTRGRLVLLLAGSFRPVIGAVFGAVLLVLTHGGLLPFSAPGGSASVPGVDGTVCFFIGLSFLAGFSERWAQDTIVSSAPKMPPGQRSDSSANTDTF